MTKVSMFELSSTLWKWPKHCEMLWINSLFHHIVIFKHTLGLEIFSFEFNHTLGLEMFSFEFKHIHGLEIFSFEFKHTLGLEIFSFEFQYTLGLKCNLGIKQFSFINKGQHLYWQLKMVESVECNEIFTKFTQQQGLKYKISKRSANLTKHPHLKLVIIPPVSPLIIIFCKNPVFRKCEVNLWFNASYDHFHSFWFWLCIPLSVEHNQKQTQPQVLLFFKPNSNTLSAGRI